MANGARAIKQMHVYRSNLLSSIDEITTAVGKNLAKERAYVRRVAAAQLPDGTQLEGEDGFEQLTSLCDSIESEFSSLLAGTNGLTVFEGLRRVSGRIWARAGVGHEIANRGVSELAVHRYSEWSECRDPDEPLRGWRPREISLLTRLVMLAELYANTTATRRRVAKGVRSSSAWREDNPYADEPSSLAAMLELVDTRTHSNPNWLATVGVQWSSGRSDVEPWIVAARFVDPAQRDSQGLNGSRDWDALVNWQMLETVESELALLEPLNAGLDGFTLIDLRFALDMASNALQAAWVSPPRTLQLGGYALCSALPHTLATQEVTAVQNKHPVFGGVTTEGVLRALEFLDAGHANTDLDLTLAQRPLRRIGDLMLYDAAHVHVGGPMLWDIRLPEAERDRRARSMEPTVHEMLQEFGTSPWLSGKVLQDNQRRRITDVDASVIVGDILVVVDCYASPWTSALDRGEHRAVRNRLTQLRTKLATWDSRWTAVAEQHQSLIPAGVAGVLPVVASAQAEWIDHANDPAEWLADGVPRFCTAAELVGFLRRGPDLSGHPATILI